LDIKIVLNNTNYKNINVKATPINRSLRY